MLSIIDSYKFRTFDEKRAITPRWVIRCSSKWQGS
jgi:hypothetical protein